MLPPRGEVLTRAPAALLDCLYHKPTCTSSRFDGLLSSTPQHTNKLCGRTHSSSTLPSCRSHRPVDLTVLSILPSCRPYYPFDLTILSTLPTRLNRHAQDCYSSPPSRLLLQPHYIIRSFKTSTTPYLFRIDIATPS